MDEGYGEGKTQSLRYDSPGVEDGEKCLTPYTLGVEDGEKCLTPYTGKFCFSCRVPPATCDVPLGRQQVGPPL